MAHTLSILAIPLLATIVQASRLQARLPEPPGLTITSPIETVSVVRAIAWAGVERAIKTHPPSITFACEVVTTDTVVGTAVGTDSLLTPITFMSRIAMASSSIAEASVRTIEWAAPHATVSTTEIAVAEARSIEACSV